MGEQIYQDLRAKIDTYFIGFPATSSGVEIELLKRLFTPDEAEVGVNLSMVPEPVEVIAARMNRDPKELEEVLLEMFRKGTIFKSPSPEGVPCFHGAPYMHGLAENKAGNMDPELAKLFEKYETDGYLQHMGTLPPLRSMLRFVPINEALSPEWTVAPYNRIEPLLSSKQKIAAIPCYCRDKGKALGGKSDLPTSNVCFVFDWLADYSVERGQAHYLSLAEALEIQQRCEDAGLVNMPTNLQSPFVMCHCDGDFCINFRALKMLPKPADVVISDYYTQVDEHGCNGCELCIEWCPMEAIVNSSAGAVGINLDRCIGCGVCISKCNVEALRLLEKPEARKKRKPIDVMEFLGEVSRHRAMSAPPVS